MTTAGAELMVALKMRDDASKALQGARKNFDNFAKGARQAGAVLSTVGAAGALAMKSFISSAQEQQIGIRQLDQALKNVGTSYAAVTTEVETAIEALQRKTNFGDEAQRDALRTLISIGGDYQASLEALPAVLDLAADRSMDLNAAALLVGKALSGETASLSRYGILLEEGASQTEVMAAITKQFSGAAAAAANPLTQMKNRMGDVAQIIGDALLPFVEKAGTFIESMARDLQNMNPTVLNTVAIIGGLVTAFALVAGPALLLIGFLPAMAGGLALLSGALGLSTVSATGASVAFGALNLSMGPILIAVVAVAAAIAAGILIWKNWDKIVNVVKATWTVVSGKIDAIFRSKWGWLLPGGPLIKAILFIKDNWASIWGGIKSAFQTISGLVVGIFNSKWGWLLPGGHLVKGILWIKNNWAMIWENAVAAFEKAAGFILKLAKPLVDIFKAIKGEVENLEDARAEIQEMGDPAEEAGQTAGVLASGIRDTNQAAGEATPTIKDMNDTLAANQDAMKETAAEVARVGKSWDDYRFGVSDAGKAAQIMEGDTTAALDAMAQAFQVTTLQFTTMLEGLNIAADDTRKIMETWPDVAVEAVLGMEDLGKTAGNVGNELRNMGLGDARQSVFDLEKQVLDATGIMADYEDALLTTAEAVATLKIKLEEETIATEKSTQATRDAAQALLDQKAATERAAASWDDYRFGVSEVSKHLQEHRITTEQILDAIGVAHRMSVAEVILEFEKEGIAANDLEGIIESSLGQGAVSQILKLKGATEDARKAMRELADEAGKVFDSRGRLIGDENTKGMRKDELGKQGELNAFIRSQKDALSHFRNSITRMQGRPISQMGSNEQVQARITDRARTIASMRERLAALPEAQKIALEREKARLGLAAGGVIARAGIALVGERGPELVSLPRHARVFSNQESRQMTGRSGDVHVHLEGATINGFDDFERQVTRAVLNAKRRGADL